MKKAAHSPGAYRIRRLSRSGSGNSPNATSRVTARQTGGWSGNRRHAGPDETRDDSLHRRALACPRGRPGDSFSFRSMVAAISLAWLEDRTGNMPPAEGAPAAALPLHMRCGKLAARSEEHTSELQSLMRISYSVFCLNK